VYGLVELHRDTSEWSAQGLSNSLAALVEAGARTETRVVILESREVNEGVEAGGDEERDVHVEDVERVTVGENEQRGEVGKWWKERVPMLNGSVRRAGLEGEDGGWSGRTVAIGSILGRWCRFGRGDWETDVGA